MAKGKITPMKAIGKSALTAAVALRKKYDFVLQFYAHCIPIVLVADPFSQW